MGTLVISQAEIRSLLPMRQCIDVVRDALATLATGDALLPLRSVMWLPDRVGALGMMPAFLGPSGTFGVKTVSVFPGNAGTELDSHQGTVMLFDAENGSLRAIVDATEITAIRTAAASAVATSALANNALANNALANNALANNGDAPVLAILGSGSQAATHLEAMLAIGTFAEVRIWSRQPANTKRFVESHPSDATVLRAVDDVAAAVQGADVVCTTTASNEPVLHGALLEPGMHINAVGSSVPFARELDGAAMARCRLFVDRRESLLNESGDYLMAKAEGAVTEASIVGELGQLLIGSIEGRRDATEITLFKSLGLAIEDLAAADLVYRNAAASGAGTEIELGGSRHG